MERNISNKQKGEKKKENHGGGKKEKRKSVEGWVLVEGCRREAEGGGGVRGEPRATSMEQAEHSLLGGMIDVSARSISGFNSLRAAVFIWRQIR